MSRASTLASNHGVARVPWEGWNAISRVLLVLWIALLAVDRIDFLGGEGAFILTPFLVLTPLLLVFEGFRVLESRARIQLQREGRAYLVLLLLFLSIVLISTLLAQDPLMSAKRSALLVFLGMSTFAVAVTVSGRKESKRALVVGAKLGLIVAVVFAVAFAFALAVALAVAFAVAFAVAVAVGFAFPPASPAYLVLSFIRRTKGHQGTREDTKGYPGTRRDSKGQQRT